MKESGLKGHLAEFVGSGYETIDQFEASNFYQKAQENLHDLAKKTENLGNEEGAKNILELSASLAELYENINQ